MDNAGFVQQCSHQNVYFGVVNIRYQNQTIGAVDVWRCTKCMKTFAEEKQLGILDLSSEIGMPHIEPDEKWAVLVCKLKEHKERWALVRVKDSGSLKHACASGDTELRLSNYAVQDDRHRLIMVDQSINKEVEID